MAGPNGQYFQDMDAVKAQTPEAQALRQARVEQFVAHIPVALEKERREYPWGRGQFGERRGLHGDDF